MAPGEIYIRDQTLARPSTRDCVFLWGDSDLELIFVATTGSLLSAPSALSLSRNYKIVRFILSGAYCNSKSRKHRKILKNTKNLLQNAATSKTILTNSAFVVSVLFLFLLFFSASFQAGLIFCMFWRAVESRDRSKNQVLELFSLVWPSRGVSRLWDFFHWKRLEKLMANGSKISQIGRF